MSIKIPRATFRGQEIPLGRVLEKSKETEYSNNSTKRIWKENETSLGW